MIKVINILSGVPNYWTALSFKQMEEIPCVWQSTTSKTKEKGHDCGKLDEQLHCYKEMRKYSNLNVYESQLYSDKKYCLDDTRIPKAQENY